jgi:hypothetical protein
MENLTGKRTVFLTLARCGMGWLYDGVSDEEHEGSPLGVLVSGVIPTAGTGNATYELAFQGGWWAAGGGAEDPGVEPGWLLPACVCGWRGDRVAYDEHAEDVARGRWDAHMDTVTIYMLPVAKAVEVLVETLEVARTGGDFDGKPLGVIKALRLAQGYLGSQIGVAVGAARAQELSWEQIGEALGVARQTAHERYREVDAVPARSAVA